MIRRLLYINNEIADIDSSTAIGIDLQVYDIKEPAKPKAATSNNISLPRTARNMRIIGAIKIPNNNNLGLYDKITVNYILGNDYIIENAFARVESISDRINLVIFAKNDVWAELKKTKIPDIIEELTDYLIDKYNYPSISNKTALLGDFLQFFVNSTSGIIIPFYFSNLYDYRVNDSSPYYEGNSPNRIYIATNDKQGGHFAIFIKDIFEFIEQKYSISFNINDTFDGNIFQDGNFLKTVIPIQSIISEYDSGYYITAASNDYQYSPLSDVSIKSDKSLHDFIISTFAHYNCIADNVWINGTLTYKVYRFDDLLTKAPILDWSNRTNNIATFKPYIDGHGQTNYIRYKAVYDGGSIDYNAKKIYTENKNIEAEAVINEINAFCGTFALSDSSNNIPKLDETGAFNNFSFLIITGGTELVLIYFNSEVTSKALQLVSFYDINSEYSVLQDIILKPITYEVELWLTIFDIRNLVFFAQYYIRELGGCFFINKISGFNPLLGGATKIQLLKVSNDTPKLFINVDIDYFTDGQGNYYSDGQGNFYN